MLTVLSAAAAFLPVSVMVAVGVLRGAVGLTNRFLAGSSPRDDDRRAAWYTEPTADELPEPGVVAAVVPTAAAVAVAAAVLFGYAYVAAVVNTEPSIRPIEVGEVISRMTAPYALLAAVPVFLLFRTRALAGLLRTSTTRAGGVVAAEVLIWAALGATAVAGLTAFGFPLSVTV